VVLTKAQKKMKRQADRGRKEVEEWKVGDRVILSTENLVFKEQLVRKLVYQYVGLYIIDEIISTNVVTLQLPTSIRIHPVVNVSQIAQYNNQVERQKKEVIKPIEVKEVEE